MNTRARGACGTASNRSGVIQQYTTHRCRPRSCGPFRRFAGDYDRTRRHAAYVFGYSGEGKHALRVPWRET